MTRQSTIGKVANNVNAASKAYVNAQITQAITQFAIEKAVLKSVQMVAYIHSMIHHQLMKYRYKELPFIYLL
jgi:hypothetical protein